MFYLIWSIKLNYEKGDRIKQAEITDRENLGVEGELNYLKELLISNIINPWRATRDKFLTVSDTNHHEGSIAHGPMV